MADLLYVQLQIDNLKKKKAGIVENTSDWENTDISALTVQVQIDILELVKKKVLDTETLLHQLRLEARDSAEKGKEEDDALILKVKGIYAKNTNKWAEYGVDAHDALTAKKEIVPAKGMIKSITDDSDNKGFIVKGQAIKGIDVYEWQRGVGSVADDHLIPDFVHLTTNRICKIVDTDVEKGIRYFYRYRGYNINGFGEWSEPSSKIQ